MRFAPRLLVVLAPLLLWGSPAPGAAPGWATVPGAAPGWPTMPGAIPGGWAPMQGAMPGGTPMPGTMPGGIFKLGLTGICGLP